MATTTDTDDIERTQSKELLNSLNIRALEYLIHHHQDKILVWFGLGKTGKLHPQFFSLWSENPASLNGHSVQLNLELD